MFAYCTALNTAPELPAETLAEHCYDEMFSYCSKLTTAPELPATRLAGSCYNKMFSDCKALTTAPELSAESLAEYCYKEMFSYCTSLKAAPMLHVIFSLAANCFERMFYNCTKLSSVTLFIGSEIDQNFNPHFYLSNWLNGAGTEADSPQLYLSYGIYAYYNYHRNDCTNESLFPENWHVQPL